MLEHGERIARAELAQDPERRLPRGGRDRRRRHHRRDRSRSRSPSRSATTADADFTGCAPQARGPINCSTGALLSACKTVVRAITAPQAPLERRLLPPVLADRAARHRVQRRVARADRLVLRGRRVRDRAGLEGARARRARSGSAPAATRACAARTSSARDAATDELFVLAEPNVGGWGGSALGDGESALIATTDGDTYNFPVEVVESAVPRARRALRAERRGGRRRRAPPRRLRRRPRVPDPRARASASGYGCMGGSERRPGRSPAVARARTTTSSTRDGELHARAAAACRTSRSSRRRLVAVRHGHAAAATAIRSSASRSACSRTCSTAT